MEIGGASSLFEKLYCADFVINDDQVRVVELASDDEPSFDPVEGEYGSVSLRVRSLQWDGVILRHDLGELPQAQLKHWFERWFDLDDSRYEEGAEILCIVHSLLVQPGMLSIDFGTAEPAAFWDILDLLKNAGASSIDISSSRAETELH